MPPVMGKSCASNTDCRRPMERQIDANRNHDPPTAPQPCSKCNSTHGPARCWWLSRRWHRVPSLHVPTVTFHEEPVQSVTHAFNSQIPELVLRQSSVHGLQKRPKSKQLGLAWVVRDSVLQFSERTLSNFRTAHALLYIQVRVEDGPGTRTRREDRGHGNFVEGQRHDESEYGNRTAKTRWQRLARLGRRGMAVALSPNHLPQTNRNLSRKTKFNTLCATADHP